MLRIVKQNFYTHWVEYPDGNIIKRKTRRHPIQMDPETQPVMGSVLRAQIYRWVAVLLGVGISLLAYWGLTQ